jgi:hypothetical protein
MTVIIVALALLFAAPIHHHPRRHTEKCHFAMHYNPTTNITTLTVHCHQVN